MPPQEIRMKLYGFKNSRSNRVEWMLQEVGADYEFVKVDLQSGENKKADHTARHAHALVPALEDGKVRMIESAAACLYLADKYRDKGFAPAPGTAESARYYQMAVYAVSTLDETVVPIFFHTMLLPENKRSPELVEQKMAVWNTAAELLTRELGEGPYLLGKSFSAADVIVGYDVALAERTGLLKGHPALLAYAARLTSREAFKKAYAV
jgi:glutathione S-transferase